MGFEILTRPFPWTLYSKKLKRKIESPHSYGLFTKEGATSQKMRLAMGSGGTIEDGNTITFYWLVDPKDGQIVDAKYQLFGQTALIGAAEVACELLVGKNYDQARRISADLLDKHLRDQADVPAFPPETYPHMNLVIEAIDSTADQCKDLPLPTSYAAPPVPINSEEPSTGGYPNWLKLIKEQKLSAIEQVLDRDLRPYIALDGGGVEIVDLKGDFELIIAYQGACTSCLSAVGATLSYIQQVMRSHIHPNLQVIPHL